ncbi:MAG: extracellular solute-binding protein [Lachnospiraceae bacterium]|jgi:putative aldouronate transport system substrate-binding protein|nr:extracellular solute-binding protein [Lachnospiraceae bacterium]MCI9203104.1 extracellular solute-binding protein [Lachnospiraceae bacterium]
MKKKKIMAAVMAAIMTLGVFATGCGSASGEAVKSDETAESGETAKSEETAKSDEAVVQSESENFQAEGTPILKEKETFTIAIKKEALSQNTMDEKECVIFTENETNVHINWIEIPSSGWDEKVNVMFAGDDLPDAFIGSVNVMKYRDQLAPINDYIDQYAPNIQQIFEDVPEMRPALTTPDGNIYSLPTGDDNPQNQVGEGLYINKEWLDNLGLEMPETIDEFYDVLVAFRDRDPNGNGEADEIPLCITAANDSSHFGSLFGTFGTLDNNKHIRVENDKVVFTPAEDGYYAGLQWFHKLYEEGLMNRDYFTEQFQQWKAKGDSEVAIYGVVKDWYIDNIISTQNTPQYVCLPAIKGADGTTMWDRNPSPNCTLDGFTITKNCKNPEVLVRWYDYINSGLDILNMWNYGPVDTGAWHYLEDGRWEVFSDNVPEGSSSSELRRTAGVGPTSVYAYWKYRGEGVEKYNERFEKKLEAVNTYLPVAPENVIPIGYDDLEREDERNILLLDIDTYLKSFVAESVTQGIDDEKWEEHLKTLESLNVERYTELYQVFYDSKK